MFVNPEVPLESLPSADHLDWHPLHPRFVRRLQVGALLRVLVIGTIGVAAYFLLTSADAEVLGRFATRLVPAALTAFAVFAAWLMVWPVIAVPRRGYVVRDKDILYKSGVLWRSVKAVPFNRVQHTKIDSGLLDRRFGLANLSVFPAGAGGHKIRGLGAETAEQLRVYVSERIETEAAEAADDQGLPTQATRDEANAASENGPAPDEG